jgi:UDP-glucose 4-epimerase
MRVFVTGASGFIGSHVTRALINAGHDVLALVTPSADLWRINDVLHKLEITRGTLQDLHAFQDQLLAWQPQACIHLAWYAEPGKYLNSSENLVSLQGSLNLLQLLAQNGCSQFIGAGTCAEYEITPDRLRETDKTKPETLYAAAKLSFQMLGEKIAAQTGMHFSWGRIFYLYGKQEDHRRIIPSAILSIQNGKPFSASPGEQIRDYLYITDVANAFLTLLEQRAAGIYNICSSEVVSIRFILDLIGNLTGRPELLIHGALPYRDWEPMFICGDNSKLSRLGWEPKISLKTGLRETILCLQNESINP